jgi:DNA polymerase V
MRIHAAMWWISFDPASLEENPGYTGPVCLDFYGRLHPVHAGGTVRFRPETNSRTVILEALDRAFREKVDPGLLVRRLGLALTDPREEGCALQMDMFSDPDAQDREFRMQEAMLEVRGRFGSNLLVRGMNMLDGATAMERNKQRGGHRA